MKVGKYDVDPVRLEDFLSHITIEGDPLIPAPVKLVMSRNEKILRMGSSFIGVQEWKSGSNPVIERWLDHGASEHNRDSGLTDDVPHCAGYIASMLEETVDMKGNTWLPAMTSTNSLMARSYEKWGMSSKAAPLPGDIWVKYRRSKSSGYGHVGILLRYTKAYSWILGANQNDECNITRYSNATMTDVRRSSKEFEISSTTARKLEFLADSIIAGKDINTGGRVT